MPASKEIFEKYMNPVFIETGTYEGDGIQQALDGGFEKIYSIELNEQRFKMCSEKFKNNFNVTIYKGDSSFVLKEIIKQINTPVTFWLDAHNGSRTVLINELNVIKDHPIKNHVILIDDMRCWKTDLCGFDAAVIKEHCLSINKDYKFSYENGVLKERVFKNDILVVKL